MKVVIAAVVIAVTVGSAPTPDVGAIRDKLDAYLLSYEPQLSALVAEEQMTQRIDLVAGDSRSTSEVAFVALPGQVGWLGFRRVIEYNGKRVRDAGPPLAQLLSDGSDDQDQARLLLEQSASYNLGAPRTTNLPNLPLELLHPRHRHRFEHRLNGLARVHGVETIRLIATERSSPTIIQQPDGRDLKSTVTAWIEVATGRLVRAEVRSGSDFPTVVWVDFKPNAALGMWIPSEMREQFLARKPAVPGNSVASYSKYRRFQTSGRIVPPVSEAPSTRLPAARPTRTSGGSRPAVG